MKKLQRILALLTVLLLIGLYGSTLVFALLGKGYFQMLMASVTTSILLPVFIWLYTLIYKQVKARKAEKET